MKLNVLQAVKDSSGKEIMENESKVILRRFLIDSLGAVFQDEMNLDGNEKYKRGKLANFIQNNDEVEISIEELALLKKLTGKAYSSSVVFSIWNLLEGKE